MYATTVSAASLSTSMKMHILCSRQLYMAGWCSHVVHSSCHGHSNLGGHSNHHRTRIDTSTLSHTYQHIGFHSHDRDSDRLCIDDMIAFVDSLQAVENLASHCWHLRYSLKYRDTLPGARSGHKMALLQDFPNQQFLSHQELVQQP